LAALELNLKSDWVTVLGSGFDSVFRFLAQHSLQFINLNINCGA